MLGVTLGNQRLKILDFGKHNYTIIPKENKSSFRLTLNPQDYDGEDEYKQLSHKMLNNR